MGSLNVVGSRSGSKESGVGARHSAVVGGDGWDMDRGLVLEPLDRVSGWFLGSVVCVSAILTASLLLCRVPSCHWTFLYAVPSQSIYHLPGTVADPGVCTEISKKDMIPHV